MLRRPPTTLSLTPADIQAYESTRAQRLASLAAEAKRKQKLRAREKQRADARREQDGITPSRPAGLGATGQAVAGAGTGAEMAAETSLSRGAADGRSGPQGQGHTAARPAAGRGGVMGGSRTSARGGSSHATGGAERGQREIQAQRIFGRQPMEEEDEDDDEDEDEEDEGDNRVDYRALAQEQSDRQVRTLQGRAYPSLRGGQVSGRDTGARP